MDYTLKHWAALMRYLDDPALPIDNNYDEQQIRTWALGRANYCSPEVFAPVSEPLQSRA